MESPAKKVSDIMKVDLWNICGHEVELMSQALTFDNLAALLPAAIAMQNTTKKIKPSPFAMKTSMLV